LSRFHYTKGSIISALKAAGIKEGDILFSHVSLLELGLCQTPVIDTVISAIKEVIGIEGSFLTPAFSYSFCSGQDFDPLTTKSEVGAFSNALLFDYKMARSVEPIFSLVGFGPHLTELYKDLPSDSFGKGCIYERLLKLNAKVCNIGLSFIYLTPIHYLEKQLDVPYRFDKTFTGSIKQSDNETIHIDWVYYVRKLVDGSGPDCSLLNNECLKAGKSTQVSLGLGHIYVGSLIDIYDVAQKLMAKDPCSLIQASDKDFCLTQ
jgi:aminoglycoside 3-N-acetyltransferase